MFTIHGNDNLVPVVIVNEKINKYQLIDKDNVEERVAFINANIGKPLEIASISLYEYEVAHVVVRFDDKIIVLFRGLDLSCDISFIPQALAEEAFKQLEYPGVKSSPIEVAVKCSMCNNTYTLRVNQYDYEDWLQGKKHAQDALPYLTADERELLISHICGECFDKLMM